MIKQLFAHNHPPNTPVTIVVQQHQLNELAGTYLADHPAMPLQGAEVTLSDGAVELSARTSFSGLPIRVEIIGQPLVRDGIVRFAVQEITMNGAPAPGFIAQQIEAAINSQLGEAELPIHIEGIEVTAGEARIVGRTK